MTEELLELLWILEVTVALDPELAQNLDEVVSGQHFVEEELPKPTDQERKAPTTEEPDEATQATLPAE